MRKHFFFFLFLNERGSNPKEEQLGRHRMRTTNSHNISKKQQWSNIKLIKQVNKIKNLILSHSMQVNKLVPQ
jgi:hypothetical protein